jgi:hypothetical protein
MIGRIYSIIKSDGAVPDARKVLKGSTIKYSLLKGFGESYWNLCPVCDGASVRTTVWEDGTVEHGECLICSRMADIMEIESSFLKDCEE